MTLSEWAADDLEMVIRASSSVLRKGMYYVSRSPPGNNCAEIALIIDEDETTRILRCDSMELPAADAIGPYSMIQLRVSKPFRAPGFIAAATTAIAAKKCTVYVVSTYSYDYVLVPLADTELALKALLDRGFGADRE